MKLTLGQRYLLSVLARYAGRRGCCSPSQGALAAELDCSERTIQRLLIGLVAIGAVQVIRRRSGNEYHVRTSRACVKPVALPPQVEEKQAQLAFDFGLPDTTTGVVSINQEVLEVVLPRSESTVVGMASVEKSQPQETPESPQDESQGSGGCVTPRKPAARSCTPKAWRSPGIVQGERDLILAIERIRYTNGQPARASPELVARLKRKARYWRASLREVAHAICAARGSPQGPGWFPTVVETYFLARQIRRKPAAQAMCARAAPAYPGDEAMAGELRAAVAGLAAGKRLA